MIALGHLPGLNKMSAVFPGTVGVILLCLGVVCLVQSLFGRWKPAEKGAVPASSVVVLSLGMAGYVLLIPWLGFLAATLLFAGMVTLVSFPEGEEFPGRCRLSPDRSPFVLSLPLDFYGTFPRGMVALNPGGDCRVFVLSFGLQNI